LEDGTSIADAECVDIYDYHTLITWFHKAGLKSNLVVDQIRQHPHCARAKQKQPRLRGVCARLLSLQWARLVFWSRCAAKYGALDFIRGFGEEYSIPNDSIDHISNPASPEATEEARIMAKMNAHYRTSYDESEIFLGFPETSATHCPNRTKGVDRASSYLFSKLMTPAFSDVCEASLELGIELNESLESCGGRPRAVYDHLDEVAPDRKFGEFQRNGFQWLFTYRRTSRGESKYGTECTDALVKLLQVWGMEAKPIPASRETRHSESDRGSRAKNPCKAAAPLTILAVQGVSAGVLISESLSILRATLD
jgi:hypothetical protein